MKLNELFKPMKTRQKEEKGKDQKKGENLSKEELYQQYEQELNKGNEKEALKYLEEYCFACKREKQEYAPFGQVYKLKKKIQQNKDKRIRNLYKEIVELLHGTINKKELEPLFKELENLIDKEEDTMYHSLRGLMYQKLAYFPAAIKEYKKAVSINPYNAYDYYHIIQCYLFLAYNEKEAREALPYLEQYKFYRSNPEKESQKAFFTFFYTFIKQQEKAKEILLASKEKTEEEQAKYRQALHSITRLKYKILQKAYHNPHLSLEKEADIERVLQNPIFDYYEGQRLSKEYGDIFEQKEKPYQENLDTVESLLHSDQQDKLDQIETYVVELNMENQEKAFLILDVALLLAEQNYPNTAKKFLKAAQTLPEKTKEFKNQYQETKAKIKIKLIAKKS